MDDSQTQETVTPLTRDEDVRAVAREIATAGLFALDLEFVSESRYVPELGLVQLAWGAPETPEVVAVDPLEADPRPLVELVEDASVDTVLHAAQGDLALLGDRFDARGQSILDTQIAAAFLGLGNQVGYTTLIDKVLGVGIEKTHQFTDWLRRPLSDEQVRYAIDDVRYLLPAWHEIERRLVERDRLTWVREESEQLARRSAVRTPPEEVYRRIKGWDRLSPPQLGALAALAAWREREALGSNTPPAWLLKDRPLLELARRPPGSTRTLGRRRGVPERTARHHGEAILEALEEGVVTPIEHDGRGRPLSDQARTWAAMVNHLIKARCREADIASRFVANRDDAETLVRWWVEGDRSREPELPLLAGWRRRLAGQVVLDWLAGHIALLADGESPSGLRLLDEKGE